VNLLLPALRRQDGGRSVRTPSLWPYAFLPSQKAYGQKLSPSLDSISLTLSMTIPMSSEGTFLAPLVTCNVVSLRTSPPRGEKSPKLNPWILQYCESIRGNSPNPLGITAKDF
jgi:hypothetical protein